MRSDTVPGLEVALGFGAALIGASGALLGAWLSGRHQVELEHKRWERARHDAAADARARAIGSLTEHLAAALHTIVWFTFAARWRAELFAEQAIVDYDAEMRTHFTNVIQSLVGVAYHDISAYRELEPLVRNIWSLDGRVAIPAAAYWSNPQKARTEIASVFEEADSLEVQLPELILGVLRQGEAAPREQADMASESATEA
jgi:hypothetical protein